MSLAVKDANNVTQTIETLPAVGQKVAAASLPVVHATDDPLVGALAAVLAALDATLAVSAQSLPLPTGAATDAKLETIRALLAGTLGISAAALPLPAGAATSAKQDAQTAAIGASAPADNFVAVAPSDTVALAVIPKALLIGGAGNLAVKGGDNNTVTIAVTAGQILPIRARYVMATNTTATGIVAIS